MCRLRTSESDSIMKPYCAYLYWGGVAEGLYDHYEFCFRTCERMSRAHRWCGGETVGRQVFVSLAKEEKKIMQTQLLFRRTVSFVTAIIPPSLDGGGVNVSQTRADPTGRTSLRWQFISYDITYIRLSLKRRVPSPIVYDYNCRLLCACLFIFYIIYLYIRRTALVGSLSIYSRFDRQSGHCPQ